MDSNELRELESIFDERYVKQATCNEIQSENAHSFANDDKRIELMQHDFAVIKKLVWVVATASIGSLVTAVFELIQGAI